MALTHPPSQLHGNLTVSFILISGFPPGRWARKTNKWRRIYLSETAAALLGAEITFQTQALPLVEVDPPTAFLNLHAASMN